MSGVSPRLFWDRLNALFLDNFWHGTARATRCAIWWTSTPDTDMEKIIKAAVDRGASDLHIKAGDVFRARIDGKLVPLTKQALTPEQTRSIAMKFIPNDEDRARIDKIQDYDCSWGAPGIGRFRVNILRQRSSFMIVMRVIPFEVPTFEQLALPPVLKTIADAERGMVLVTGVTGSGKSSTMAAMINHINVVEAQARRDARESRSSSCTATSSARSRSARSAWTPRAFAWGFARRCARIPT